MKNIFFTKKCFFLTQNFYKDDYFIKKFPHKLFDDIAYFYILRFQNSKFFKYFFLKTLNFKITFFAD